MGKVVKLRACRRCGESGKLRTIYFRGKAACSYYACDPCVNSLEPIRAEDREIRRALQALDVEPDAIAVMMMAKIALDRAREKK